jgi:hypothetical protein
LGATAYLLIAVIGVSLSAGQQTFTLLAYACLPTDPGHWKIDFFLEFVSHFPTLRRYSSKDQTQSLKLT